MPDTSRKSTDRMSHEAVAQRHSKAAAEGEAEVRRERDERARAFERVQSAAEAGGALGSPPFAKPRIFE